ncbi:MAG: phosphatase PAP2 family protein [Bacteroidales bacterium]|nr:phosphatase PAP2 family protein [Bacteroidales bacterium]
MIELDQKLFLFLNSLHSPFFDMVMWILSLKTVWIPLYVAIIWMITRKYGRNAWIPLLIIPVLVLIDDQGSTMLKNLTQRPRPCHEPDLAGMVHTLRGHCGGMYSFVSGHAANSFGVAAYSASLLGRKWYSWSIFVWAALVSYSRIYLGVHYPGDVLAGALLGLIAGTGLAWMAERMIKNVKQ